MLRKYVNIYYFYFNIYIDIINWLIINYKVYSYVSFNG